MEVCLSVCARGDMPGLPPPRWAECPGARPLLSWNESHCSKCSLLLAFLLLGLTLPTSPGWQWLF